MKEKTQIISKEESMKETVGKDVLDKSKRPIHENNQSSSIAVLKVEKEESTKCKYAIDGELELLKKNNRYRLPSIVEATRETPSICHTIPSPVQRPSIVDEYATINSETDHANSFE